MPEKVKSSTGKKQVSRVMKVFAKGRLRSRSGKTVTDPEQAQAIAMSEGRSAEEHGVKKRTWKGRSRIRPILSRK
jgi:hypothetical protein